jgi:nitroimidazol reductase NimA-like FMN-containing flavoprotein (pyridoxamine 5'-phosphate oxidase superfamily)
VYDRDAVEQILDEALYAHLGFVHHGQPFVIPTLHARVGDMALEAFVERMVPGRWGEVRKPSVQELKGTRVLSMSLAESSAKVRTGAPEDDPDDLMLPVWAGVIPVHTTAGAPIPDDHTPPQAKPSAAVTSWTPQRLG